MIIFSTAANIIFSEELDLIHLQNRLKAEYEEAQKTHDRFLEELTELSVDYQLMGIELKKLDTSTSYSPFLIQCIQGKQVELAAQLASLWQSGRNALFAETDTEGNSGLHWACRHGHVEVVKVLMKYGAIQKPNKFGFYPIHLAVGRSTLALESLADLSSLTTKTCKDVAAINQIQLLEALDPTGKTINQLDKNNNYTPVLSAAFYGNLAALLWLEEKKANFVCMTGDGSARTVLHNAAYRGHGHVVRYLLDKKFDPYVVNKAGETPLFEALYAGHIVAARAFVSQGVWLNAADMINCNKHITTYGDGSLLARQLNLLLTQMQAMVGLSLPVTVLKSEKGKEEEMLDELGSFVEISLT